MLTQAIALRHMAKLGRKAAWQCSKAQCAAIPGLGRECGTPSTPAGTAPMWRHMCTSRDQQWWKLEAVLVGDQPSSWRRAGFDVDDAGRVQLSNTTIHLVGDRGQRGILGWELVPPAAAPGLDPAGHKGANGDGLTPAARAALAAAPEPVLVDGVLTRVLESAPRAPGSHQQHPNTALGVDHVVVKTPSPPRSFDALAAFLGSPVRGLRVAKGRFEMGFFRFAGPLFAEVVGPPPERQVGRSPSAGGSSGSSHREGAAAGSGVAATGADGKGAILDPASVPTEQEAPASLIGITVTVEDIDKVKRDLGDGVGNVKDAVQSGRRIVTVRHKDMDISVHLAFMTPHVKSGRS